VHGDGLVADRVCERDRLACRTVAQKASTVCPDRLRPLRSVRAIEIINGSARPSACPASSVAVIAALAFSVSNILSISLNSTAPSTRTASYGASAANPSASVACSTRTFVAPAALGALLAAAASPSSSSTALTAVVSRPRMAAA
jgi:hypothetical protein